MLRNCDWTRIQYRLLCIIVLQVYSMWLPLLSVCHNPPSLPILGAGARPDWQNTFSDDQVNIERWRPSNVIRKTSSHILWHILCVRSFRTIGINTISVFVYVYVNVNVLCVTKTPSIGWNFLFCFAIKYAIAYWRVAQSERKMLFTKMGLSRSGENYPKIDHPIW